jgi:hypothetical protein
MYDMHDLHYHLHTSTLSSRGCYCIYKLVGTSLQQIFVTASVLSTWLQFDLARTVALNHMNWAIHDLNIQYHGYRVSFTGVKRPGRGASHPIPSPCRGSGTGRAIPLLRLLGPQGLLHGKPLPFISSTYLTDRQMCPRYKNHRLINAVYENSRSLFRESYETRKLIL